MRTVFVGSLGYSVSENSLKELFGQHGAIERVEVIRDRETGRSRGFAFVQYANEQDAVRAIAALDKTEFGGRALTVNEAKPRPERNRKPDRGTGDAGAGIAWRDSSEKGAD